MTELHCLGTFKFNGEECPVTNLFDIAGDETKDPSEAVSAVILTEAGRWVVVEVDPNEIRSLQ